MTAGRWVGDMGGRSCRGGWWRGCAGLVSPFLDLSERLSKGQTRKISTSLLVCPNNTPRVEKQRSRHARLRDQYLQPPPERVSLDPRTLVLSQDHAEADDEAGIAKTFLFLW